MRYLQQSEEAPSSDLPYDRTFTTASDGSTEKYPDFPVHYEARIRRPGEPKPHKPDRKYVAGKSIHGFWMTFTKENEKVRFSLRNLFTFYRGRRRLNTSFHPQGYKREQ